MDLVEQIMTSEPYASAKRVFWIVDNGSSRRGKAAADRLAERFPNAVMVHTPVHASWLNQVEIFFSIVQRKVVTPQRRRFRQTVAAFIDDLRTGRFRAGLRVKGVRQHGRDY